MYSLAVLLSMHIFKECTFAYEVHVRLNKNLENIIGMMNKGYEELSQLQAEALVGALGAYLPPSP